eukprot:TRINITY_DN2888_c0_g1_i1.p1 TRINITY_DN2888_c0_g1~~TRINITY_DN2888_c0_g1_i1.p1  ORF type:complete len:279 (-),score=34.31 TRINITY_DN2888_c0_g1_i1:103-939(-)
MKVVWLFLASCIFLAVIVSGGGIPTVRITAYPNSLNESCSFFNPEAPSSSVNAEEVFFESLDDYPFCASNPVEWRGPLNGGGSEILSFKFGGSDRFTGYDGFSNVFKRNVDLEDEHVQSSTPRITAIYFKKALNEMTPWLYQAMRDMTRILDRGDNCVPNAIPPFIVATFELPQSDKTGGSDIVRVTVEGFINGYAAAYPGSPQNNGKLTEEIAIAVRAVKFEYFEFGQLVNEATVTNFFNWGAKYIVYTSSEIVAAQCGNVLTQNAIFSGTYEVDGK